MIEEIKRKNGSYFRARIYGADGSRKSKSFPNKTLAKEWERRILRERDEEEATGLIVKDSITLEEFAERWLKESVAIRLADSTQARYRQILQTHLIPALGKIALKDLRSEHAEHLVAWLKRNGHAPKGISNILGVLITLLNQALDWHCLARNPLASFKPVKEPELHFDYWTAPEIRQFLNANLHDPLHSLYLVALNTGMRRGEPCALQWDRVDFIRNQLIVSRSPSRYGLKETTKSGRKRYVLINPSVKEILQKIFRAQKGKFVFSEENGEPIDAQHLPRDFVKAQTKAGFMKLIRFHDLRHTFASHFMMNGGNIYDLQKILGHSSLEMTQRYGHMSRDHLAEATQIVAFQADAETTTTSL
jgi:integrase